MDTATASRRRQAFDDALDTQRALNSVATRARRIYSKPRVERPQFSALDEIKAKGPMAQMGREFARSRAPMQRKANVANAKAAGTFDTIREKYNRDNMGKAAMNEDGDITGPDSPPPAPAPKAAPAAPAPQAKPAAAPASVAKPSVPSTIARPESQRSEVVKAGTSVGDMIKGIDSAIAQNKEATQKLSKSFARRPSAKTASLLEPLPTAKPESEGDQRIANTIRGRPLTGQASMLPKVQANLAATTPAPDPLKKSFARRA